MNSHPNDVVLLEEEDPEEEDNDVEEGLNYVEDDDDEEDLNPVSSSAAAVGGGDQPPPPPLPPAFVPVDSSRRHEESKKPAVDDNRKLFQRLWTDEDEIELLQGFLDYTTQQRGTGSFHHHDTNLFYDQIKSKFQLDFNKNQLVEKLRRLKKKYRNVLTKISSGKEFSFKNPHDHTTFEISRKIWNDAVVVGANAGGVEDNVDEVDTKPNINLNNSDAKPEEKTPNSRKRSRSQLQPRMEEKRASLNDGIALNSNVNASGADTMNNNSTKLRGVIEETVKSCLSPFLKEFLSSVNGVKGFNGVAMSSNPLHTGLGFGLLPLNFLGMTGDVAMNEKWKKQQILELEVLSKRLQLVQDQINSALDELRSVGS